MTLAQLKTKANALKIGGRVLPSDTDLSVYQEMIFEHVFQLCSPLNLSIPYQDRDIVRPINEDGDVEWFLRKPRIAETDTDFIDIDSRLDMAFVYYLVAFVAADSDKASFEAKADRVCVDYACAVLTMGLPKAKEVYEEESFISDVRFDCIGRMYHVQLSFINAVIDCLLCGSVCLNAAEKKQLDLYKGYLDQDTIRPVDVDTFRAIDIAVFMYILDDMEAYESYSEEELSTVTTLFCEFDNISHGLDVPAWILEADKRIAIDAEG